MSSNYQNTLEFAAEGARHADRAAQARTDKSGCSCWLVERYVNDVLHFWSAGARGRGYRDDWSIDVNFATRLADADSASQVHIRLCEGEGRIVQHVWLAP